LPHQTKSLNFFFCFNNSFGQQSAIKNLQFHFCNLRQSIRNLGLSHSSITISNPKQNFIYILFSNSLISSSAVFFPQADSARFSMRKTNNFPTFICSICSVADGFAIRFTIALGGSQWEC